MRCLPMAKLNGIFEIRLLKMLMLKNADRFGAILYIFCCGVVLLRSADNGMTSSGEQHPAHMRSISPVLTEIGFSFMALTLSAVVYMANFEGACLFFNL